MESEPGGPPDVKAKAPAKPRQTKTPLQKEVLEASYQLNQHPSVEHRKALGDRIGLTEQEVQAWFTNRRRRDKAAEKKAATATGAGGTPGGAPSPAVAGANPPGASPAAAPGALLTAPAGTLPHVPQPATTPGAAGPTPGSAKAKTPRPPKAPKLSPVAAAAPPAAAAPAVPPLPPLPPTASGAPAGLARHAPPPVPAPVSYATSSAAVSGGGSMDAEEETEDADDEAAGEGAAAAWEGIRALCMAARATLPVPYREDGPPLGFLFDEPPMPGEQAAGAGNKRRRIVLSHDLVAEADEEGVKSVLLRRPGGSKPGVPGAAPVGVMTVAELEMRRRELQLRQQQMEEAAAADPEYKGPGSRKAEDALRKEQERLRKELQRQQEKLERDRKREEDERSREMERHERERKKLADKMEKDRAKEEARKLKELERLKIAEERELKRLEAAREKERKAEERRRALEERKKEKETARALAQQERAVLRMRHRESANAPPDDEELEYRKLLVEAGIDPATVADVDEDAAAAAAGGAGGDQPMAEAGGGGGGGTTPPPRKRPRPDLPRPEFPPPSLGLQPAWPAPPPPTAAAEPPVDSAEGAAAAEDVEDGEGPVLGEGTGSEVLICWSFLRSFADLFGLSVPSVEGLMAALAEGEDSRLLGEVHCVLLRLLQADMEDAHDEKERIGRATTTAPHFMDRSVLGSAHRLEEAWAWGFEVDAWRAHLNSLTWPEVLRQVAVVSGRGRTRPPARRSEGAKGPRIQGFEGEDVLDDGTSGGGFKLRMPARYVHGTVKAAAWQVLSTAGPCGLSVSDIVRRIQKLGLREMRSSKTPEAVVAQGLSRDVLFLRVAPATWALSSVVAHNKKKNEKRRSKYHAAKAAATGGAEGTDGGGGGDAEMTDAAVKQEAAEVKQEREEAGGSGGGAAPAAAPAQTGASSRAQRARARASRARSVGNDSGGGPQAMDVDGGSGGGAVKEEPMTKEEEATTGPADDDGPDGAHQGSSDGGAAAAGAATGDDAHPAGGADPSGAAAAGQQDGQPQDPNQSQDPGQHPHDQDHDEESYSGEEDEEEGEGAAPGGRGAGDPWVATLLSGGYGALGLRERIEALSFLCHAVLDSPSLRAKLELRINEAAARKKAIFDEVKNEKRKRQEEAAARAAAAAEEARKRAEAAAAAVAGGAGGAAGGGSRGSTPAPPGAPVDPKAIAGEIFGAAAGGAAAAGAPQDPAKAAAEAAKRAEEEEEERQKRQQRTEELLRIDEDCAIRAEPLGSDRRYNRYWLFTTGAEDDPGSGRLWVESAPDGNWRLLTTAQQLDELVASLEPKGAREGALAQALARHGDLIRRSMPGVAPLSDPTPLDLLPEDTRTSLESAAATRAEAIRLLAQGHLGPGDDYTEDLALPDGDSARVRRFKQDLLRLEAALPPEAVDESFHRTSWVERVQAASGPAPLRTCLGQLEAALLPSPDGQAPGLLATVFHRNPPLVRGAWVEVGREVATALPGHASREVLPPAERPDGQPPAAPSDEPLSWLPPTMPALTLRLLALDAAIVYRQGAPPGRDALCGYKYTVRPAPRSAQPLALAAAAAAAGGEGGGEAPAGSAALPLAVGGGAVVLTNVLADRGRVREVSRRVPELPAEMMTMRSRDFTLPVEEMRESVAEADRQGLLTAAAVAAAAAGPGAGRGGHGKGKGSAAGPAGGKAAGGSKGGSAAAGGKASKSVVVVSGGRGAGGGGGGGSKSKGGSKAKGGAAAPGVSKSKGGSKAAGGGSKAKAAAPATEEPEGDDEWIAGTGEQLGEPVLLGPEDEEDLGFASEEDDAPEEGYDDPNDSDYDL